jgi:hypothetical protein
MRLLSGTRSHLLMFIIVGGCLLCTSLTACIVRELPTNGLPCGDSGECSTGLQCYVVGGRGNLCLQDSKGFEPYKPGSEPASKEPSPEPAQEPATPDEPIIKDTAEPSTPDAATEPDQTEPADAATDRTPTDSTNPDVKKD